MGRPVTIVEVIKVAAQTLVEHARSAKGKTAVGANGEPGRDDGPGLGWTIELKLVVGCDIASTALLIFYDAIFQRDGQCTGFRATL